MGTIAFVGILFSMLSIRLMGVAERAQIVIAGVIGQPLQKRRGGRAIVAMTMGTRKFFVIKVGIAFFSKTSSLIFFLEGMYAEKLVQGAAVAMLNTTIITTTRKVQVAARKHGTHAARKIKKNISAVGSSGVKSLGRPFSRPL